MHSVCLHLIKMFLDVEGGEVEPWRCGGYRRTTPAPSTSESLFVEENGALCRSRQSKSSSSWTSTGGSFPSRLSESACWHEYFEYDQYISADDSEEDLDESQLDLEEPTSRPSIRHCGNVSGLPLICSNCGVSFFSLRSIEEDEDVYYCSGECKWSVIMCREMDRRMQSLHQTESYLSSYGTRSEYIETPARSSRNTSCR